MNYQEMLVETPVALTDIKDEDKIGHVGENQCTSCGVGDLDPWYPDGDITVVRHWTKASVDEPGDNGGKWTWYCPDHLNQWGGRWWPHSDLAPARLLPNVAHACERPGPLKSKCGEPATIAIGGVWTCPTHRDRALTDRRIAEVLASSDD